jgi:hypothetical protein
MLGIIKEANMSTAKQMNVTIDGQVIEVSISDKNIVDVCK